MSIPQAKITLTDGTTIAFNARVLERKGKKPKVGFFSSKTDAFEELVRIFKAHAA